MNQMREIPIYCKKFQMEVVSIIKQVGCPTFLLTLLCVYLRWNHLAEVISELNNLRLQVNNIENMDYFEKCSLLNSNPVFAARHFQYRNEMFLERLTCFIQVHLER